MFSAFYLSNLSLVHAGERPFLLVILLINLVHTSYRPYNFVENHSATAMKLWPHVLRCVAVLPIGIMDVIETHWVCFCWIACSAISRPFLFILFADVLSHVFTFATAFLYSTFLFRSGLLHFFKLSVRCVIHCSSRKCRVMRSIEL